MLTIIVIIVSEHSIRFSHVIARKNPVATLATLSLLSYAKLLRTIIITLSFSVLHYPQGSDQVVWLPDATVGYLNGKHIALFIVAVVIFLASVAYTTLLFFWQRLVRCQHRRFFKWVCYQKLCHFIDAYHAPYTFKHRYVLVWSVVAHASCSLCHVWIQYS